MLLKKKSFIHVYKSKVSSKEILKYKTVLKHEINEVLITFNSYKHASLISTAQIVR